MLSHLSKGWVFLHSESQIPRIKISTIPIESLLPYMKYLNYVIPFELNERYQICLHNEIPTPNICHSDLILLPNITYLQLTSYQKISFKLDGRERVCLKYQNYLIMWFHFNLMREYVCLPELVVLDDVAVAHAAGQLVRLGLVQELSDRQALSDSFVTYI